jgi:hypothetical protein
VLRRLLREDEGFRCRWELHGLPLGRARPGPKQTGHEKRCTGGRLALCRAARPVKRPSGRQVADEGVVHFVGRRLPSTAPWTGAHPASAH